MGTAMAKKKRPSAKYFGKPLTDDPDDAAELLNDLFRHGELRHGERRIRRGRRAAWQTEDRDHGSYSMKTS
jgi:hypothetical protein